MKKAKQKAFQQIGSNAIQTPYERSNQNHSTKLDVSHYKWHFNKLEAGHAINHMKDVTNITLHILKVSHHID